MYRNIITQQSSDSLPVSIGATYNPTWQMCRDAGWRVQVDPPAVADGYERLTPLVWVQDPENVDNAVAQYTDTLIHDRIDAEAAAEALRLETPIIYDQPIQAKLETPATDGHVYGLEVDPVGGELVPVQRESTRLTQAEYDAAKAARLAERAQHRTRIAAIETDLNQVESALDQIDTTQAGALGVAIEATTGTTRTALRLVRTTLADFKTAAKNLKQASEKIRREIR